jgi:hypothetical protein
VSSRDLATVRISPGEARPASFSRPALSSSNNKLATLKVVAIQKCSTRARPPGKLQDRTSLT